MRRSCKGWTTIRAARGTVRLSQITIIIRGSRLKMWKIWIDLTWQVGLEYRVELQLGRKTAQIIKILLLKIGNCHHKLQWVECRPRRIGMQLKIWERMERKIAWRNLMMTTILSWAQNTTVQLPNSQQEMLPAVYTVRRTAQADWILIMHTKAPLMIKKEKMAAVISNSCKIVLICSKMAKEQTNFQRMHHLAKVSNTRTNNSWIRAQNKSCKSHS